MNEIKQMLINLARFYNHDLDASRLDLYAKVLNKYPLANVLSAGDQYMMDTKNSRFPIPPHVIMDIYKTKESDSRELAIQLVRKIDQAVIRHGGIWETGYFHERGNYWESVTGKTFLSFKEAVLDELGEIGWHAICTRGGWTSVCKSSNEMEEGVYIAQMRDQIQASISLSRQGVDVTQIEMPKQHIKIEHASQTVTNVISLMKPRELK